MNCTICKSPLKTTGLYPALRERLEKNKVCHSCDGWLTLWQHRNDAEIVRVKGQHYMINDDGGIGYPATIIKDGKLQDVTLMHQGTIPKQFANVLPDNAVFTKRITVR